MPAHGLRLVVMDVDLSESDGADRGELSAVLDDQIRLDVLSRLQDADVPVSLADLATDLAREEVDDEGDRWARAECYYIQLYHNHVPVLEGADLVEYDRGRGTVALASSVTSQQIDDALSVSIRA